MRLLSLILCTLAAVSLWTTARSRDAATVNDPSHHEVLVPAVTEHRLLQFGYDGEVLMAEPHAYGVSREDRALLRAYVPRPSRAGDGKAAWLLFRVDRMTDLVVSAETFDSPRTGYRKGDKMMAKIYAEY